jgi:hypothetical protein
MDEQQFDRWTASLTQGSTRRTALRGLGAVLGLGGVSLLTTSTPARRRKGGKGGGKGGGGGGGNGGGGNGGGGTCTTGCTSSVCGQVPAGCPILPANNIWNTPIDGLPRDARSNAYIQSIGGETGLHPDFGSGLIDGQPFGIPFVRVGRAQPPVAVRFDVADESDPGPYPIPADAPIEGGSCANGDRHVIVVQEGSCTLYELFDARQQADGSWVASSGAVFDLESNALRPDGWTSADAAGLPILPGLVRYEEIAAGSINHALRFTAQRTQEAYVWPARHEAGATTNPDVPPLGQRFRLKAEVDLADFSATNQIILQALKTYGMFLADNGSDWFLSGVPDDRWDNDDLRELQERITGRDFEAVDSSSLIDDPDSGQVA